MRCMAHGASKLFWCRFWTLGMSKRPKLSIPKHNRGRSLCSQSDSTTRGNWKHKPQGLGFQFSHHDVAPLICGSLLSLSYCHASKKCTRTTATARQKNLTEFGIGSCGLGGRNTLDRYRSTTHRSGPWLCDMLWQTSRGGVSSTLGFRVLGHRTQAIPSHCVSASVARRND